MRRPALFSILPCSVLLACSTVSRSGIAPPTGAKIEPSGYATILKAPPAPYDPPPRTPTGWEAPLPPGETRLATDDVEILQYRWDRGISLALARAEIAQLRADGPEARAVEARAKAAEPDNFVQLGILRLPVAAWKFAFKRNPEESLRRYTSNPRFVADRLPYTAQEADRLWAQWWPRFEPYATYGGKGAGGITLGMKISEEEFRALPQFRDFVPPPGVKLEFPNEPDLPRMASDAAPFVRILPQQRYFPGIILVRAIRHKEARITLRDGCLFFGDALVRLNRTAGLFRDAQGYLAIRDRADLAQPHVRIGEPMEGGGGYSEEISEADRAAITSRCGNHPVIDLYSPKSKANWRKFLRSQNPVAQPAGGGYASR